MSEEMPEDIRKAARAVVERGYNEGLIEAVERALMAERERANQDALRYRWLRADNAYCPEEEMVHGGEALDELCDEGIATSIREGKNG